METMIGMPGTISAAAKRIVWVRVGEVRLRIHGAVGNGTEYEAKTADGVLRSILSSDKVDGGPPLWHLSVSHRDASNRPDRCPTWDELKSAKYQLVQKDCVMVLIFPRRNGPAPYVDYHPTTLHLWEDLRELDA